MHFNLHLTDPKTRRSLRTFDNKSAIVYLIEPPIHIHICLLLLDGVFIYPRRMFTQAQAKQETQSMNNYEYTYFQVYNKQCTDGS